jgi:Flp pilus assembly protein TadD
MLYLSPAPRLRSSETQRAIHATEGYIFLGLPEEALGEIQEIRLDERDDPLVLLAEIRSLLHLGRWRSAESLSRRSVLRYPDEGEFAVQRAVALQQLHQSADAERALLDAPEWIRRTGILHYNLACYQARLGYLSEARQSIGTAIQLNARIKNDARIDPDLQKLWN